VCFFAGAWLSSVWLGCMSAKRAVIGRPFFGRPHWTLWTLLAPIPRPSSRLRGRKRDCVWVLKEKRKQALMFLARHTVAKGFWQEAEKYCFRLLDFNVPEKEEAKLLLKSIHHELQKPSQ
jgi:hypothetical protein